MKFDKRSTPKGVYVPASALKISGISSGRAVELHTLDNLLILLKGRMTAMELITVVEQLQSMAAGLLDHLSNVCGPCKGCESSEEDYCPYNDLDGEAVSVNDYLLQDAGIPKNAKLCAEVDQENHQIIVSVAGHRYDLRDLPRELVDTFAEAGACLGKLEKHLMMEDIVYGEGVR